jgi:hypothetical protein
MKAKSIFLIFLIVASLLVAMVMSEPQGALLGGRK